jgi:hypothetical protein
MDDEWVILVQLLVVGTVIGGVLTYIIRSLVGMLLPSLKNNFFLKKLPPYMVPWRKSISRPISPISSMACGEDTTRPCREGFFKK